MTNDSKEQADGNERPGILWIMLAILAVLLVLALPAGFLWHRTEVRRLQEEAAVLRMELEKATRREEEARQQAEKHAEEARKARLAAEEVRRGRVFNPD